MLARVQGDISLLKDWHCSPTDHLMDQSSSNIGCVGRDIGCPSSPAHLRFFYTLETGENVFPQPTIHASLLSSVPRVRSKGDSIHELPTSSTGEVNLIYSQRQHNDRYRTYKLHKVKKKFVKRNTTKDE